MAPRFVSLDATEVELERTELAGVDVTCYAAKTQADIPEDLSEADVVAVWHTIWLDRPLLSRCKKAKCIVRMGVGYDNVDIQGEKARSCVYVFACAFCAHHVHVGGWQERLGFLGVVLCVRVCAPPRAAHGPCHAIQELLPDQLRASLAYPS
jgi:hypothetical protein